MEIAVVTSTEWDREFIADFASERTALGKAQVVRVTRQPAADQTGLLGDKPDVIAVAHPTGLRKGKNTLVDDAWRGVFRARSATGLLGRQIG
jgi:hypothetical protein